MSGIPRKIRQQVYERDHLRCRRCGKLGESIQHRIPRGMGGSKDPKINALSNLVMVCGDGTRGCHGWIESHRTAAYRTGWLVHRTEDPEDVPVESVWGYEFRLLNSGEVVSLMGAARLIGSDL